MAVILGYLSESHKRMRYLKERSKATALAKLAKPVFTYNIMEAYRYKSTRDAVDDIIYASFYGYHALEIMSEDLESEPSGRSAE